MSASVPQHAIIGVCGHIDHGKTALVKALTGICTDRLKEEKERGISIESGFAYLETPWGTKLGIIDAPGHERFVGNMLSAANGIDIALLTVAADEGVMPQTREHLDILRLLGVRSGIIAVTKLDLTGHAIPGTTRASIKETVKNTFLQDCEIIGVSVKTDCGIEQLRAALIDAAEKIPPKSDSGAFRLPIDRVFTVKGFGTVVTGTLTDGGISLSSRAMLYPGSLPARIRGLQVHSRAVETAKPGERLAVNLAVKKEEISRGDVLAASGSLTPSAIIDAELEMLENPAFRIKNASRVHLYIGGKKRLARVILLDAAELSAGGRGFARLKLAEPVAVKRGDRFITRFYSPETTVGGGVVLDENPPEHLRRKPDILARLVLLKAGQVPESESSARKKPDAQIPLPKATPLPLDEVEQIYLRLGLNPCAASIAAPGMDPASFLKALSALVRQGILVRLDDAIYMHKTYYSEAMRVLETLGPEHPARLGMYRDALKTSRRVAFALLESCGGESSAANCR